MTKQISANQWRHWRIKNAPFSFDAIAFLKFSKKRIYVVLTAEKGKVHFEIHHADLREDLNW